VGLDTGEPKLLIIYGVRLNFGSNLIFQFLESNISKPRRSSINFFLLIASIVHWNCKSSLLVGLGYGKTKLLIIQDVRLNFGSNLIFQFSECNISKPRKIDLNFFLLIPSTVYWDCKSSLLLGLEYAKSELLILYK
jgi:hypothetical protein